MKIGIISMQRVPNYGSFLQAYGLKRILENLGHKVVFIDYKEGAPAVPYNIQDRIKYLVVNYPVVRFLTDWIRYNILGKKLFDYKYRLKYLKELNIGYKRNHNSFVDAVIIGSDEVFNCLQSGFNVGFSPMLFGQNLHANKVISYAASFGYTGIDGLKQYGLEEIIREYLKTISSISVRDDNSYKIIESLVKYSPKVNLDPVLVSDFPLPRINIPYHDYVILYTYKSRKYSDDDKKAILEFCDRNEKVLISIGDAQGWVPNRIEATPLELLAYICSADFIITDTFHGSVFSIKYNRPFVTMIRDNNKQKLEDLLQRVNRSDRIIKSFWEIQALYEKPIDFAETNRIIDLEKKNTIDYLSSNLIK